MTPAQQNADEPLQSTTPCPACGHGTIVGEFAVRAAEAAQHFVLEELDACRHRALAQHIRSLWGGDSCSLMRCAACGCRFAVPFVGGDETFYTLAYQRTGYPGAKWEYRRALDFLDALPRARRRILEIGAGNGRFIATLPPQIVRREDVVATEFSDYGIGELRRLGVTALKCDFRTLSRERCGGGFDVVCLFQVLEHLDDLDRAFAKFRELCNDGGVIVLSTPNDARIRFNEANSALIDMPPNHLTLWTRDAMERVASRNGFRLVEHCHEPKDRVRDSLLFLKYRFLRASHRRGSIANAIGSVRNVRSRRVLATIWIGSTLPAYIPGLIRCWRHASGESQLAVLLREPAVAGDGRA